MVATSGFEFNDDFIKMNKFNPQLKGYQLIEQDVEIQRVGLTDLHITLLPRSNRWGLIYYVIMAKLAMNSKPIFMKTILTTHDNRVYTISSFIYNPHVRFKYTLTAFID